MENKILLLKIIKNNQPLGIHKMDRLFHDVVDFSISWLPIIDELEKEGLIEKSEYKITQKGIVYIQNNSD